MVNKFVIGFECNCFSECISKFGEKMGAQVWEAVNKCFDCMPIAATVDKKVAS